MPNFYKLLASLLPGECSKDNGGGTSLDRVAAQSDSIHDMEQSSHADDFNVESEDAQMTLRPGEVEKHSSSSRPFRELGPCDVEDGGSSSGSSTASYRCPHHGPSYSPELCPCTRQISMCSFNSIRGDV
ncbi:hypothetical protein E1B28_010918 [Marasmius oreades]|uniref:Uncharacterized protein n=1 Tax=Marasmius oreades TaxID=181124 RepID=A0A9P7RT68_9AGAR|nr:uncharacterized protein E1B28_010918 [Marasmius oreades]KAG7089217.1 hypothetical protein E1B28_010918 [Marasmius oreades]